MGIISDAPLAHADTKETKRHTMYNPIPSTATNGHTNGYAGHDSSNERFYESPNPMVGPQVLPTTRAPVDVDDMDDGSNQPPANFGALVSSMIRPSPGHAPDDKGTTSLRMQSHRTSHTKSDNKRGISTTQETTLASASISKNISTSSYSEEISKKVSVVQKQSSKDKGSDDDNENDDQDDDTKGDIKILADSSIPPPTTTSVVASDKDPITEGEIVSSQTITSRSRTVETTTYALEREGGEAECHVEQKVTIQSDGDPIDHDEALAQAIQEATAMNPDMTVEKIEIHQTSTNPDS